MPRGEGGSSPVTPSVLIGCDFSSSPTRRKPIVIAEGAEAGGRVLLARLHRLATLDEFGGWLGPDRSWTGAFDFPFGLPRELGKKRCW